MKRSLVVALILGALVSALIIAAHATGLSLPLERGIMSLVADGHATTKVVSPKLQYALVLVLSFGAAWLVLASPRRKRLGWPLAILALELVAVIWVCLLYGILFQPLPSLAALALGFFSATGYAAVRGRSHSGRARDYFRGRVSDEQFAKLAAGEVSFDPEARSFETTALVCDIANKHDLAEECSPAVLAQITEKFVQHTTDSLKDAGAYIETVTGEGVVAFFGFPGTDDGQAEKATRHALTLLQSFEKRRGSGKDDFWSKFNVHIGISSGTTIIAPLEKDDRPELLSVGEPVELARRFCIANRFYGSSILIGPRTFEMASPAVLARPVDFLSGVDARERHEIYEPIMLAAEATPEQIARRDSFWNGVVLYREKRWAEAYSQFQNARGPNDLEDAPLQLYLRRLEPLALQLIDALDG
ncbi:MAG: adenylate/guanylate cyclase domain-containing protein [Chthoniobacterales bacterium]